jgi:hydrogenase maturation protease
MERTLIIGYGNPDREDDGVAWHILCALARRMDRQPPESYEAGLEPCGEQIDLLFRLQLTPEMAETIAAYERVCFIDAHTGAVPEELNYLELEPLFQASPFTHHMTPETCLALSDSLYGNAPRAVLFSVRGYEFGFSRSLSPRTADLADTALDRIWEWVGQDSGPNHIDSHIV